MAWLGDGPLQQVQGTLQQVQGTLHQVQGTLQQVQGALHMLAWSGLACSVLALVPVSPSPTDHGEPTSNDAVAPALNWMHSRAKCNQDASDVHKLHDTYSACSPRPFARFKQSYLTLVKRVERTWEVQPAASGSIDKHAARGELHTADGARQEG